VRSRRLFIRLSLGAFLFLGTSSCATLQQIAALRNVQFSLDRVSDLRLAGIDLGGNELDGAVEFCAGAIVTPEAQPIEPQLIKFEKKIEAGAEFFQTQAIYDLDNFKRFMEYARKFPVKILAGIVLLSSARMARIMNENVPGIFVPQELIDELASAPRGEAAQKGIEIARTGSKNEYEIYGVRE